jgi:hypothetical protein
MDSAQLHVTKWERQLVARASTVAVLRQELGSGHGPKSRFVRARGDVLETLKSSGLVPVVMTPQESEAGTVGEGRCTCRAEAVRVLRELAGLAVEGAWQALALLGDIARAELDRLLALAVDALREHLARVGH